MITRIKRASSILLFALAGIFAALIITIGANSAYAQSPDVGNDPNPPSTNQDTAPTNPNESGEEDDELSCAISKIGWILCPLIETFASVGDQAFQFLATTFLETEPELVASVGNVEGKSGTYIAWELARNIANILFIIAFLIIILSQVTGRGIDNYGIKKTLPRLVIAAIAVNVSYYICQAMVDLSNILGYEIQNFLVEVSRQVSDQTAMPPNTGGTVNSVSGGTLGVVAAAILGASALVWVLLPILMLGVGTVVITCIVIIIILLLRKAFIVLLVVASPIAFVAYLLPNTESYFRKWLSMFWKLLMVFPVVGLLFGGGQLASAIILVAGTSNTTDRSAYSIQTEENADKQCVKLPSSRESTGSDNPDNPVNQGTSGASVGACESRSVPLMLGLVAAGIAVAPLLAVWAVLKGALNGAGAIGGKITGAVDTYTNKGVKKFGEGPGARMSKRAGIAANNSRLANFATGGVYRRRARKKRIDGSLDKELNRAEIDYTSGLAAGDKGFQSRLAGGRLLSGDEARRRAEATAIAEQDKLRSEGQQAASVLARDMSQEKLREVALKDGVDVNDPMVAAAIEELGEAQDFAALEKIMDKYANAGPSLIARSLSQALSKNATGMFTGGQIAAISKGAFHETDSSGNEVQRSYLETVRDNLANGSMSAEKLASINPSIASEVSDVIARTGSTKAASTVNNEWTKVKSDSILNKKISRIERQVDDYSAKGYVRNPKRW